MMKFKEWKAASAVLAVLLAFSLYGSFRFLRMPTTVTKNNVDLRYTQRADYSYEALVKHSLLYDNRTTLTPGEPLYTKLVEQLKITLLYELDQNPVRRYLNNTVIHFEATGALSGGDWEKSTVLTPRGEREASFSEEYELDLKVIEDIIEQIASEIGTPIHSYTYEIRPRITLEATTGEEEIREVFTPKIKITFTGGKIDFDGMNNTRTGLVTHTEREAKTLRFLGLTTTVTDVRWFTVLLSIFLSASLYISTSRYMAERASRPFMEALNGDIRDRIVEVMEPTERAERERILVASINDLVRISDEIFKPIMHHRGVFYVIDGDVGYEYRRPTADEEE